MEFHVKAVYFPNFPNKWFDMELHVKHFHVTHVKLVLAVFDKEIPCHFFLGIRTCDYEAETVKKTKANIMST